MKLLIYAACSLLILAVSSCSSSYKKSNRYQASETSSPQVKADPEMTKARKRAQALTQDWPQSSVTAATETILKHGDPTEITDDTLVWGQVAPFEKITVKREVYSSRFPVLHQNAIDHVVLYKAAANRLEEVRRFSGDIVINSREGKMTASGQDEAMNILSLNLADEIFQGRISAGEARTKFGQETLGLLDGKKTAYTQTLKFGQQIHTEDLGKSMTDKMRWKNDQQSQEAGPGFEENEE